LSHLVWSTMLLMGGHHASAPNPQLRSPLKLPGCKRLHLSFSPSWAARWSGRAQIRILSGVRCRGCVRHASSSRPRAHRRRPRPTVWVVGCESRGLRCRQLKPASTRASSAVCSRCPPGFSRSLLTSRPPLTPGALAHHPSRPYPTHPQSYSETARLQALASEFWPVLGGSIVGTGENPDRKRCGRGGRWVVAYAAQVPAGPERTDDVLGPRPGWVVALGRGLRCRQLKPASTRASSAGPSRWFPGFSLSLLTSLPPLTLGALTHHPLPYLPHSSSVPPLNCPAASACI